jgi:acetyltransferase-like isoleucine patch superfamily enzyme
MKNLIIIGSGAVASEITSYLEDTKWGQDSEIEIKGYLEYEHNIKDYWGKYNFSKPVLGDIDAYEITEDDCFVIGVAQPSIRATFIEILLKKRAKFINLIHPSVILARTAQLGIGNVIYPYSQIGPNAQIGNFNLLTCNTTISHDTIIGNNNFIAGDGVCGHVVVGNNNVFGVRSVITPGVTIGNNNKIQAGMIVDKNVIDDSTVFHRFKEKVIAIPQEN